MYVDSSCVIRFALPRGIDLLTLEKDALQPTHVSFTLKQENQPNSQHQNLPHSEESLNDSRAYLGFHHNIPSHAHTNLQKTFLSLLRPSVPFTSFIKYSYTAIVQCILFLKKSSMTTGFLALLHWDGPTWGRGLGETTG